jgi:hypothetical protein
MYFLQKIACLGFLTFNFRFCPPAGKVVFFFVCGLFPGCECIRVAGLIFFTWLISNFEVDNSPYFYKSTSTALQQFF